MLHAGFRKSLIRIHLLHHGCSDKGLEPKTIANEISSHGYDTSLDEICEQLEHLHLEGYLKKSGDIYLITEAGEAELAEVKDRLRELCEEVS